MIAHRGANADMIAERAGRILKPKRLARLDASSKPAEVARAVRGADVICATPFIAKDLTIQGVGLLAIIGADAALSQTEYRAAEDAFATWWRATRWAGRGRVFIETAHAEHPAVVALARWDPDILYRAEAARRRELGYPPFAALARIDVPPDHSADVAREVSETGLETLGPVETEGHTVVVVRSPRREQLLEKLQPIAKRWREADEPMRIDVDPWEVLVPKWRY
jgi:primosomal protein N' (replication factor Y)